MTEPEDDKKKKKKGDGVLDTVGDAGEAVADGCGCDLPVIALTIMAGTSLLLLMR